MHLYSSQFAEGHSGREEHLACLCNARCESLRVA
jgi:hypothetical protein